MVCEFFQTCLYKPPNKDLECLNTQGDLKCTPPGLFDTVCGFFLFENTVRHRNIKFYGRDLNAESIPRQNRSERPAP